jgi:hypothetical protein
MRLDGQGHLVPGTLVDLEMDLDDARETVLKARAHIRWSAPAVHEGRVVAGLEFLDFDRSEEQFRFYSEFLDRLARSMKPLAEQ